MHHVGCDRSCISHKLVRASSIDEVRARIDATCQYKLKKKSVRDSFHGSSRAPKVSMFRVQDPQLFHSVGDSAKLATQSTQSRHLGRQYVYSLDIEGRNTPLLSQNGALATLIQDEQI